MKMTIAMFLGMASACIAHASLALPNSTYLGIDDTVSIPGNLPGTSNGYNLGYVTTGGGGEFLGTITTGGASPTTAQVAFWCVDDQLGFDPLTGTVTAANTNTADVVLLSAIAANPTEVRYSGVTDGGTPGWTNITANGSPLPTSATARYLMAAYLVQQYNGFSTTISAPTPASAAQANAIQEAIWDITSNTSSTAQGGIGTLPPVIASNTVSLTSTGYWVKQAIANYSTVNPNLWAVVSWGANATTGALDVGNYSSASPALQTLLVEVPTPEPGLYGVVTLGLGGLYFGLRRRKRV